MCKIPQFKFANVDNLVEVSKPWEYHVNLAVVVDEEGARLHIARQYVISELSADVEDSRHVQLKDDASFSQA